MRVYGWFCIFSNASQKVDGAAHISFSHGYSYDVLFESGYIVELKQETYREPNPFAFSRFAFSCLTCS